MGNAVALLLLLLPLLVSSSRFLLHEARPLHSSTTKEAMVTAVRKGGGAHGDSNGSSRGYSNGDSSSSSSSSSPYGKAIPLITQGAVPKSLGASSHKYKHNSAHSGYHFSIAALLIISAFWLESLASLYSFPY